MIPRIVATPIGPMPPVVDRRPTAVASQVIEAVLPGPGRDRLASGEVLAVTTGQQPGLFTGPLFTIYKALSAIALARRLEAERGIPVVPVFWVAGDDHDFAESNHTGFIGTAGEASRVVLRTRPADAPSLSLSREDCGVEVGAALEALQTGTPETEFKPAVMAWLADAYRPEASIADAFAAALQSLLGSLGLAVLRPYAPSAKRAMAPWLLRGLTHTLPDGLSPVLVDAQLGRDRLRPEGSGTATRRSGERFTWEDLERILAEEPERLSPNVLLRPVVESALLPTVAYVAGPGELGYLPDAVPLYQALQVPRQTPVPRWSGVLVEARVDKVLQKYRLVLDDLGGREGELEARLVRDALPPETEEALHGLRRAMEEGYARLAGGAKAIDPTLERTVETLRNSALGGTRDLEKKLVAALKRGQEALVSQISRARAAVYPWGEPQERMLTWASFAVRYGPELLQGVAAEVAQGMRAP